MNSACLSTNFSISQGHATRSTRGCSRVIHFIAVPPVLVYEHRRTTRQAEAGRECGQRKKARLSAGLPEVRVSGLLGETREDRLRGRHRVVVDRDVSVLDVDGPRDELATVQGGRVAGETERRAGDVDRAGAVEVSIAADLHLDAASRVLVNEQVGPRARG